MGKPEDFTGDAWYPVEMEGSDARTKPEVKITHCIAFQKFRYSGENRPGMKYQDKEFLNLVLHNMSGRHVQIQIVCFDAEHTEEIHPNGLVGRDCDHGVYTKTYHISKRTQVVRIPYLRTERIKTRETKKTARKGREEKSTPTISSVLEERATFLPSPYKEQCFRQCATKREYNTTKVCLGVITTIQGSSSPPLFCLSNIIQNASEKTRLDVLKLSTSCVSAQDGGQVDIFTTEDGPLITEGECTLKVTVAGEEAWTSPEYKPTKDQILYKRVVTYPMPPYTPNPGITEPVEAVLHLSCTQSGQTSSCSFTYVPGADIGKEIRISQPCEKRMDRKRAGSSEVEGILSHGGVKLRIKDTDPCTQVQAASPLTDHQTQLTVRAVDRTTGTVIHMDPVQHALQSAVGCSLLSGRPQAVPVTLGRPDLAPSTSASHVIVSQAVKDEAPMTECSTVQVINSEFSQPGSNSYTPGTVLQSVSLPSSFSLDQLNSSGIFTTSGELLSSRVFEMVAPFMVGQDD